MPRRLCGRRGGTAATSCIYCSAGGAGGRACVVVAVRCDRPGVTRVVAAGITWTSRTLKAGWAARASHTSVIDAAGAIYVIGGGGITGTYLNDVWVSADGGAGRTASGGALRWS
jgi:hypothetical protein